MRVWLLKHCWHWHLSLVLSPAQKVVFWYSPRWQLRKPGIKKIRLSILFPLFLSDSTEKSVKILNYQDEKPQTLRAEQADFFEASFLWSMIVHVRIMSFISTFTISKSVITIRKNIQVDVPENVHTYEQTNVWLRRRNMKCWWQIQKERWCQNAAGRRDHIYTVC